jgi:glycosyltransferase involved in cell wall biosynthesis
MNCIVLIFSKDRALQLDAALRSLLLHCKDADSTLLLVLFTASTPVHAAQYSQLAEEYQLYPFLQFVRERDFRSDVLALLAPYDYVLFVVDDNMFVRDFRLSGVIESLQKNRDALGFSLRLGENTTYCYPVDQEQRLPEFQAARQGILTWNWTTAELDFGYPLEVSSSVYRTDDIMPFLSMLSFNNPNTLEERMSSHNSAFRNEKPFLLCFEQSATFCAPLNIVQTAWPNRASAKLEYNPDSLARLFRKGYRIDISAYDDFLPKACHEEVELKLLTPVVTSQAKKPKVSVIIPCYNHAQFLPEAVESVVKQTFRDWECIIVNDGSPDNTSGIARELIAKYHDKKIILLEKKNGGLADARNFGIEHSTGDYILPLDADDKMYPEMLRKTVAILDAHPETAIACTHLMRLNDETGESSLITYRDYAPEEILLYDCYAYCSLYRREVWQAVGGYNTNMVWGYEDWDFWVGTFEKGFFAKRVPEPLCVYRSKETSMVTEASKHDAELKARIVLNHPCLFTDLQLKWAKGVMNNEPWTHAIENTRGTIPDLADLFDPSTPVEIMAFILQADRHIAKNDRPSACESIKQALLTTDNNSPMFGILCNMLSSLGDPRTADEFRKRKGTQST